MLQSQHQASSVPPPRTSGSSSGITIPDELPIFTSIPWCAAIINTPGTTIFTCGRPLPTILHEDTLWSSSLRACDAVRGYLSLRRPIPNTESLEAITLVALGHGGNGHHGILHGGTVATLFDDAFTEAAVVPCLTAWLKVTYKAPVNSPGVVCCTARVVKSERRKRFLFGEMRDGNGNLLAEAESLFVKRDSKL
ncbi:HotDog domain-containing protein [Tricharina praecox]|uniref:HotDog domain-containing protein n=1 Tax=Tricharina praecox TaxID=43433 RepID=UPI00221E37D5|nr:HotDog domain-containing protein [Tricharina praecox]KAI5844820.1 HotDog domain-containing protein [Tricharina praecox]